MRSPAIPAVLLLLSLSAATPAAAASNKLIAVLPLDVTNTAGKLDKAAQASLEEMLRDVATEALASQGWTVLATQNMLQTLRDNGVDPTKCGEEDCQVATARELKAAKFISGAVQWVEGEFTASIRLIDTETGQILASARLEGESVKVLRRAFEKEADSFFVRGRMVSGQAAPTPNAVQPVPTVNTTGPKVISTKVTAALGTLTVTAKPRDSVRLDIEGPDGQKLSSGAPYENKLAKPGTWKVTATASGYGEEQQTVTVSPDDVTLLKFDLKLLGGLSIEGTPSGAAVTVEGPAGFRNEGGLPWEATGLNAGKYTISVSRQGYADEERVVDVQPGETARVQITLQKGAVASAATPASSLGLSPPEEDKRWRVGGHLGGALLSSQFMPTLGAEGEFRMTKSISYVADLGVNIPISTAGLGLIYAVGVRYTILQGFHVGMLVNGWVGKINVTAGPITNSVSASITALSAEIGYVLSFGAFSLGIEGRGGYVISAKVGEVTASGSATALTLGFGLVPGVRF